MSNQKWHHKLLLVPLNVKKIKASTNTALANIYYNLAHAHRLSHFHHSNHRLTYNPIHIPQSSFLTEMKRALLRLSNAQIVYLYKNFSFSSFLFFFSLFFLPLEDDGVNTGETKVVTHSVIPLCSYPVRL
jgi:hypothetical protein